MWRGLSNRPTRGAFISRSGAGDCGGQGSRIVSRGAVIQGRMRALGVVDAGPSGDSRARMVDAQKNRVSFSSSSRIRPLKVRPEKASVQWTDDPAARVAVLHGLARRYVVPFDPVLGPHRRMAFEVSSVPLSLTIIPGLPRRSIRAVSSRATRCPEIEVSGIAARHSRVTSSTTLSTRKRWPLANWSWTKSRGPACIGKSAPRPGSALVSR